MTVVDGKWSIFRVASFWQDVRLLGLAIDFFKLLLRQEGGINKEDDSDDLSLSYILSLSQTCFSPLATERRFVRFMVNQFCTYCQTKRNSSARLGTSLL